MKRDENWMAKADFHKKKMAECKNAFAACFKAFNTDPSKRHILEAVWREYEHHKQQHISCVNKALGNYELPTRS